jgi:predicted DCC family thiol-disulfide oxidoreductase YuxK
MRVVKYRISELANGKFRVEVNSAGPDHSENWVHTSKDEFLTQAEAAMAITRLVQDRTWLYDQDGKPFEQ